MFCTYFTYITANLWILLYIYKKNMYLFTNKYTENKKVEDAYKSLWTAMNQLTYPWISVPFGVISAWECSLLSLKCPSHDLD